ncbi:putative glucan 1, 4-alpha-glucosidase [Echria macrotheca]|uniref:Glucan 1, 4-alpha-glucosidase n=1 Tax=Echria macrotheca TaxID=438768 RepID=A0AAJ0FF88_9PEZI|nr:putative glucan 1, 4-alpha-glucosidase [Echria macrotheca]
MSTPSPTSPPKRPRLSLQIKAIAHGPSGRTSRTLAAAVDVKSPTAFNTLSNVYATAVDRSTPVGDKPPVNVLTGGRPTLRLQTQNPVNANASKARGVQTPYLGPLLDTPLTAQPTSPQVLTAVAAKEHRFPSSISMNATPPLSAVEQSEPPNFDNPITPIAMHNLRAAHTPITPGTRRRTTMPANLAKLPYTHPRSLRSILRNSPLPPLSTTKSPISPRRQSARLQEKALRHVAYNSPLEQTITTSKYTKSHIDLLSEDATPTTPSQSDDSEDVLDQTMAYTGNETRDGGQTPGPFEEMRRRMAGLQASTPAALSPTSAGGIRKRGAKRKEKKRRWVWTIGKGDDEDGDEEGSPYGAAVARGEGGGSATPAPAPVVLVPAPAPRKEPTVSVPLIAVPAPRPRTRMQVAMASAVGSGISVPVIAAPVPPTRAKSVQLSVPPTIDVRASTPEPVTAVLAPEPPTPSLSVGSSTADPVFESSGGDVEMSDASSMCSDVVPEVGGGEDKGDADEMGMDLDMTPVATSRPVLFREANQGWAPWVS